ncbi:MAG: flippase [Bacteroidota bacterium]
MSKEDKSYWLKSGSYSLLDRIFSVLLGLGNFALLTRNISKAEIGLWIQFLIVVAFIETGRSGLIQNGLLRYLNTSKKEDLGKINTASLTLSALLSLGSVVILLILGPIFSEVYDFSDFVPMFYFYAITCFITVSFYQFIFIQQANMDFRGIFWSNLINKGTLFLYILYFFINDNPINILHLSYVLALGAFLGSIIGYIFCKPYLNFERSVSKYWINELFKFGKFTLGTNLSTMAYKFTDRTMLGTILNETAISIYEPAVRLTNLVDVPAFSIAAIVFPKSAQKSVNEATTPEEKKLISKELYEKSVGAILSLILPALVFFYIFADFAVVLLGGEAYADSAPILRLTIFFALFMPFAYQFGTMLDSIGKPKVNFLFVIVGLILNIILNFIFISSFQIRGAVYGTLLTYFIMFVFQMIMLKKEFGVQFWKPIYYIPWFYKTMFTTGLEILKKLRTN